MKILTLLLFYFCTLLPLRVIAAEQARGFGTTLGAAGTDRIVSALNSHATQRSYAFWAYRNGSGPGGTGRIFDKRASGGTQVELVFANNAQADRVEYNRQWSGGNATWWVNAVSSGWHHYVITYDSGSSANAPIIYIDGVSATVTNAAAASGTITNNSDSYVIGNRGAADRNYDGIISQFAVWNRILTPTEAANLGTAAGAYNGWAADCYTTGIIEYIKMNDNPVTSSLLANPTVTGTQQQTGLDIDYACGTTLGVTITSPTSSPTYDNGATSTINLGGTATAATSITWANDRGGSGSATGTSTWTITGISLSSGANVITVTANGTATDAITVTYTPAAGPASLIGHRQIK